MTSHTPPDRTSTGSRTAFQDSKNGSPSTKGKFSPVAHASVVTKESVAQWVLLIVMGMLLMAFWTSYKETRLLEMRIEGFERALIAHGVKNTYPHLPGEDD